ncbi:hypothetical protein A3D55_03170 [Candidatus Jorgensenbacteria bacterium RIFCSPHIGHO2_02_FULL_45_20]|uniref:Uncharacterized protein n=2 Tax=Candidatus Joergenseniibacteriota TaxID=1752739 RepID=A0A1F6BNT2_9BACT|nr:MAG: hypothetical protein UX22_C0006G0005 [Candidatus Jorgensenbacteria bacterium GW2011_GWA2_45_9]OGG38528.1 MAG: hypothetical protein A3D55_03170 [Candidatus Jorgensenbacteria bacterium RIFCSPHIGHO2_02_FULL_45_20]
MGLFYFSKKTVFIAVLSCFLFIVAASASAQLKVDTSLISPDAASSDIPEFISKFYEFGLAISGILAVGMIVAGAIYYTTTGPTPQKQTDAKDMMLSAIWGLLLLFGSYLILKSINPQLIKLRAPGTGLTEGTSPPGIGIIGNCSSTTAYAHNIEIDGKVVTITDGTLKNNSTGKDLVCVGGISPIDPKTGLCQCYIGEIAEIVCPVEYNPKNIPNPFPNYSWTTDSKLLLNTSATNDISVGGCPRKVTIKASQFKTIDCDSCEDDWEFNDTNTHKNKDDDGNLVDTVGWVWPYYPKNKPYTEVDGIKKSNAICVLYAYYKTKDGDVERADLDGLKPCSFSLDTTDVEPFYPLTYGGGNQIDSGAPQATLPISNPDPEDKTLAIELFINQQLKVGFSTSATCDPSSNANDILLAASYGFYPPVCFHGCGGVPTAVCPSGGPSGNISLSKTMMKNLILFAQNVNKNISFDGIIFKFPRFAITSLTGGDHAINSEHYKGRAVDIVPEGENEGIWNIVSGFIKTFTFTGVREAFCEYIGADGRTNFTCAGIFGPGATNQHIHIEF